MKRLLSSLAALPVLFLTLLSIPAQAAAPPGPYFNGFERNTYGWSGVGGSTIVRVPSGYSNAGGYADGIPSSSGNWHARLRMGSNWTCQSGAGTQDWFPGPRTNWGGYSSTFPQGGYKTSVDIYLDVQWAMTHADRRFDWSSAINDTSGQFRRDFVFNAGTDPLGFAISGGNNSTRCGAFPEDPGHQPVQISQSGWYTFTHQFSGAPGTPLVVTLTLTQKSTGVVEGSWTRSDPTDIVGVTVGGNRYGWFVQNEIQDLAIDNSLRTGVCHTSNGDGEVQDREGHHGHFHHTANACEGGQGEGQVDESDTQSGHDFRSATVTSTTFTADEDNQMLTMIGTGFDNGLPVGFTVVAMDFGGLAPATFSLVLTDGYSIAGDAVGTLSIQ